MKCPRFQFKYPTNKLRLSAGLLAMACVLDPAHAAKCEPLASLQLNTDKVCQLILELDEKKSAPAMPYVMLLQSMAAGKVNIFLLHDDTELLSPVLNIVMPAEAMNSFKGKFVQELGFLKEEGDLLTFTEKALDQLSKKDEKNIESLRQMRLWHQDGKLWAANDKWVQTLRQNPSELQVPVLEGLGKSDDDALLRLHLDMPTIPENWSDQLFKDLDLSPWASLGKSLESGIGVLEGLVSSLNKVSSFGLCLDMTGLEKGERHFLYYQMMKENAQAKALANSLQQHTESEVSEDFPVLMKLGQADELKPSITQVGSMVKLGLDWNQANDKVAQRQMGQIVMGYLMRSAMGAGMKASEGPIKTRYTSIIKVAEHVALSEVKAELEKHLKSNIYPWSYFSSGDTPFLGMTSEPLFLPNVGLAEVQYEVLSIQSKSGENIYDAKAETYGNSFDLSKPNLSALRLNIVKGTPKEKLDKAKVKLNVKFPTELAIVKFNASDKAKTKKTSGKARFKLVKIDRDVASVEGSGIEKIFVQAFDKTGQRLESRGGSSSSNSYAYQYAGEIEWIEVIGIIKNESFECTVELDLNQGEAEKMPKEPSENIPSRYKDQRESAVVDFDPAVLDSITFDWNLSEASKFTGGSSGLSLGEGPYSGHAEMEAHYFGKEGPVIFKNAPQFQRNNGFVIQYNKDENNDAQAVFGKIKVNFKTGIKVFEFDLTQSKEQVKNVGEGKSITVNIDKNQVTYQLKGLSEISSSAFDRHSELKMESTTRNNQKILSCWGQPQRLKMVVAEADIQKTVAFESIRGEVNKEKYEAFKTAVEHEADVASTLKNLGNGLSWKYNGNPFGLAGFYYFSQSDKNNRSKLSEELVHSDPLGEKTFGYKTVPYKGYFFTYAKGSLEGEAQKEYRFQDSEKTYTWNGKEIKTKIYQQAPLWVAIPEKSGEPVFVLQYGSLYRFENWKGGNDVYLPSNLYQSEWTAMKVLE